MPRARSRRAKRKDSSAAATEAAEAAASATSAASGASAARLTTFAVLYVSYCGYYLCRKNYTFWMAAVVRENGLSPMEAGLSSSAFQMAQATSRLVLAVWIDTHSPRFILAGGLALSAALNVAMCFVTFSPIAMALLWGVNGVVQSLGWPALARVFMAWFPPAARGKWYTLLSTNQNAGSALVPFIVAPAMQWTGSWRAALFAPAAVSACISVLVFASVKDTPTQDAAAHEQNISQNNNKKKKKKKSANVEKPPSTSIWVILKEQVFLNPAMLFLSLCYMGVTCLRVIFADWAVQLLQTGWLLDEVGASSCILMLEAGGFVGSLVAGYVSDTIFKGRRAPVISVLGFLSAIPALLLMQGPGMEGGALGQQGFLFLPDFLRTGDYIPQVAFLLLGLFSFAPHVLIGLAAREWVHPKAGTSAHGLVSFIARVGGAAAGAPFGRYVEMQGWGGGMWLVVGMSLFSGFAMLPLWHKAAFREGPDRSSSVGNSGETKNTKNKSA